MSLLTVFKTLWGDQSKKYIAYQSVRNEHAKLIDGTQDEKMLYGTMVFVKRNIWITEAEIRKEQEKILTMWDKKRDDGLSEGTKQHKRREDKALYLKGVVKDNVRYAMSPIYDNLTHKPVLSYDMPDGVYVECIVGDHEHQMAGQADYFFLETLAGVRYIDVDDYKNDKKITRTNYYGRTMLPPLDHLPLCSIVEYGIQISTYARFAEKMGFVPRKLQMTAIRERNEFIPLPYYRQEVDDILAIRKLEL